MPRRILVAEDDPDLRGVLVTILSDGGYAVAEAANGAEAFVQLTFDPPEIVLLNLRMPVVSGEEVLDHLRHDPRLADLPVVVMTGGRVPSAVALAADAVVTKPFGIDEVVAAIELAAARDGSTPSAPN
jgi:CheY-like chemotaxis protein